VSPTSQATTHSQVQSELNDFALTLPLSRQNQPQQQQAHSTPYSVSNSVAISQSTNSRTTPTHVADVTPSEEIRIELQRKFIETHLNNHTNNNIIVMNSDGVVKLPDGGIFHFYFFGFDPNTNTQEVIFRGNLDAWPQIYCNDESQIDPCLRYPVHCLASNKLVESGPIERRWANYLVHHKLMHHFLTVTNNRNYTFLLEHFADVCLPHLALVPGFKLFNQLQKDFAIEEVRTILTGIARSKKRYHYQRNNKNMNNVEFANSKIIQEPNDQQHEE